MLGKFQKSELRIEVKATETTFRDYLLDINKLKCWFFPLKFPKNSPQKLSLNDSFSFYLGLIEVKNKVDFIDSNCIRFILSGGIDGYQEWTWGDGWIQSRLEGISVLPLNLGQTFNLLRLKSSIKPNII
ncbi:MAG: hypothetical protein GW795_09505 [Cyanobacteria bacterium]|nr:hypothetical protein [Cyanobacteria bacterium CG_2015-16_32_12]NCO77756.1 hypothetical protein [Cyanobacteria bacterium CG_2015-22_32_23]NCQ04426.1 hypothetical protein [Cyanobacteria bacterium CG_2015-09_32_10]NCQ42107.1 hypothetical protein [Cyanobacteria bacterium CG_2015-04_32_10]NCS83566.1 hypothetical protein [Cyanobacteria bacterium CG_2015-02_32_10]